MPRIRPRLHHHARNADVIALGQRRQRIHYNRVTVLESQRRDGDGQTRGEGRGERFAPLIGGPLIAGPLIGRLGITGTSLSPLPSPLLLNGGKSDVDGHSARRTGSPVGGG